MNDPSLCQILSAEEKLGAKLKLLNEIAEKYDISLTHFLVKTAQRSYIH